MKLYLFFAVEDPIGKYTNEKSQKKKERERKEIQVAGDMHDI